MSASHKGDRKHWRDTDEYRPPVWKSYCNSLTCVLELRGSWHCRLPESGVQGSSWGMLS
uniref:Uncharacterized protein n=1 Tax=Athene cunicularia TaxID=194338 RepID=A0A663MCZ4_ATHCN